jgi:hypothetical protein
MKYWLLAALSANLALLLIEYRAGVFESGLADSAENGSQHRPAREDKVSPSAWEPAPAHTQTGRPMPIIREKEAAGQPFTSLPLFSSTAAQVSAQTPAETLAFSPDSIQAPAAPAEPASPVPSATASNAPLPDQSEAAEKTLEIPRASDNPQKSGPTETVQPLPALQQPAQAENLTATSPKAEAKPAKNKNGKTGSSAKEIPLPQQTSAPQDKVMTSCYLAGPIKQVDTLATLLREFRPRLAEVVMSPTQGRKTRHRNSYVVYSPAPASMEESFSSAAALKNNLGIKDLYVIEDGDMKGAISLGVFRDERNAESAKNKFEQKGLQVRIKPRVPAESAYKVRMRWTPLQEETARQLEDALSRSYPDTKRINSCE